MTDSCPECVHRDVQPIASRRRGDAVVHGYRCPKCGHMWATARSRTAYPAEVEARTHRAAA